MAELAKIGKADTPVVSVYLDTRWSDEHQRNRVRIFLKNEIAKAREVRSRPVAQADLDWIQSAGEELVSQATAPDTRGVALFACASSGPRAAALPCRLPTPGRRDTPFLAPLSAAVQQTPSTLVAFVDTESARLMHVTRGGPGEEVALATDMPGHHSRGEWVLFAQSRYERHIREHRGRHFAAVAESLGQLIDAHGVERIVLAGEPRTFILRATPGWPPTSSARSRRPGTNPQA
jgi:peptide subunit release factor 1 (eRF1)